MKLHLRSVAEHLVEVYSPNHRGMQLHPWVMEFSNWLKTHTFPGLIEVVPCIDTVAIHFDFLTVKKNAQEQSCLSFIEQHIAGFKTDLSIANNVKKLIEIPVDYSGEDLEAVAKACGISVKEVIEIHSKPIYEVMMMGFLPGFPYLAGLDKRIYMPRKSKPAVQVKAGSIAIGGQQTGIYPLDSPGGWHVIGRTDAVLFDVHQIQKGETFTLLEAGNLLRFIPM